jgi:NAD(P)-dependent dehydrogenase (short-subunit alcohol dehydrogenase family)
MSGIQAHMKIALVTGANKGIGREVARQLAGKGFHVFIGARNRSAGRKAADEIAKKGGKTAFLEIDVSDNNGVAAAAREFAKASDHLDVLVNNAGIIVDGDDAILEINDELLRKTLETNALGSLRVIRAFVPLLAKSEAPRVINVSSSGGQLTGGADSWAPAYCISKTALNGVTSQLAAALPKFAVNSVCPGWVRTDMGGQELPAQWRKARTPLCGLPRMRRRNSLGNSCVIARK